MDSPFIDSFSDALTLLPLGIPLSSYASGRETCVDAHVCTCVKKRVHLKCNLIITASFIPVNL